MNSVAIATATEADVPLLLGMIRELASFEHLEHEVASTTDSLREALFGERLAAALVARVNEEPAGYAWYFQTFSTFTGRPGLFLDDLYVRPAYRKQGIGQALIRHVAKIAAELGCGRLEWIALRWNENALRFYRSIGARQMNEWTLLRMNNAQIESLAHMECGGSTPPLEARGSTRAVALSPTSRPIASSFFPARQAGPKQGCVKPQHSRELHS